MNFQPLKNLVIHIKQNKGNFQKKIHGIIEGEKMNAKIGGDDVASVEELYLSPITGPVNGSDYYVR